MSKFGIFAILVLFGRCIAADDFSALIGLDIAGLAGRWGYPIESHQVWTEDGYQLTLHRIPGTNSTGITKPPILLMHGLLSSSADWINLGPGKSIGLLLADQGFDVWLGNQRGNTWSRNHKELDPDKDAERFYDFSWHEIGYYDLPAKIDYITETTEQSQIFYIGHSQGTTSFLVMASTRPEYNDKIKLMQAFAPVARMDNIPNPTINLLLNDYDALMRIIDILKIHEFLPHFDFFTDVGPAICGPHSKLQKACRAFLNLLCGDDDLIDLDFIQIITSNAPAGSSIKQLQHYFQEINAKYFGQYDYGTTKNIDIYGQDTPPLYNLSQVTAPVTLYYANNDYLSAVVDVKRLGEELPNLVALREIPNKKFNHLEFIWASNVADLVNNDAIEEINSFI